MIRSAGAAPPAAQARRAGGAAIDVDKEFPVVRALYVNRFAAQSTKRMRQLIQMADETEINALVIDMKDEFGLNFKTSNAEWAQQRGDGGRRARICPRCSTRCARTRSCRSRGSWCSRIP